MAVRPNKGYVYVDTTIFADLETRSEFSDLAQGGQVREALFDQPPLGAAHAASTGLAAWVRRPGKLDPSLTDDLCYLHGSSLDVRSAIQIILVTESQYTDAIYNYAWPFEGHTMQKGKHSFAWGSVQYLPSTLVQVMRSVTRTTFRKPQGLILPWTLLPGEDISLAICDLMTSEIHFKYTGPLRVEYLVMSHKLPGGAEVIASAARAGGSEDQVARRAISSLGTLLSKRVWGGGREIGDNAAALLSASRSRLIKMGYPDEAAP